MGIFDSKFAPQNIDFNKRLAEMEFAKNNTQQQSSPSLDRLNELSKNLSQDKINWVRQQPDVQEKYATMTNAFNDYLLNMHIADFDNYCNKNGLKFMEDYVSVFAKTSENYVNPIDKTNQTINDLNKKLEEQASIIASLQNKSKVDKV